MQRAVVTIMGVAIEIKFAIHDPAYVEWRIAAVGVDPTVDDWPADEMELLDVLLRTHYSPYIEAACRETCYYNNYASAAAAADDWADALQYVKAAKNLFKDEDIPF